MRKVSQWRRAAIHEAGHAVIGRVLKQVCGGATIRQNRKDSEVGHGIIADPHVTQWHWEKLGRYREFSAIMHGRIMAYMGGNLDTGTQTDLGRKAQSI